MVETGALESCVEKDSEAKSRFCGKEHCHPLALPSRNGREGMVVQCHSLIITTLPTEGRITGKMVRADIHIPWRYRFLS